jgi:predicted RNA-binding protein with EMAP domain
MKQTKLLQQELNQYLTIYINKNDLLMKPVMMSIQDKITSGRQITKGQFKCIVKFIEREKQFKNLNRDNLINYFSPLIKGLSHNNNVSTANTLEQFF